MRHLWVVLLIACGDAGAGADTSADADADAGTNAGEVEVGPTVACADVVFDDVEIGQGQRLTVPLHGATVAASMPPALVRIDGADFVVQAGYGVIGTQALPVTITCADGERSLEWHVAIRPMTWTQAPVWNDDTGPAAREHTLFWIDPTTPDVMTLHGGLLYEPQQGTNTDDMWQLDLDTLAWTTFEPSGTSPLRSIMRPFPAPHGTGFWAHGGDLAGKSTAGVDAFDGAGWSMAPVDPGPAVTLHATVYDAPRDRLISVFGLRNGFTFQTQVMAADVVRGVWEEYPTNGGPDPRYGFAYALQGDRLVVVSGARAPVGGDAVNAAHDVWALTLGDTSGTWTELAPSDGGHAFRNAAFAYDPESERLFIFGGTADGATAVHGLHILELRRGAERWVHLDAAAYTNAAPPDRASCSGAWDPKRHRFVLGFGNSEAGLFTDLWTLSL